MKTLCGKTCIFCKPGEQMKRRTPHTEADAKKMMYCTEQQKPKGRKDLTLIKTNKRHMFWA